MSGKLAQLLSEFTVVLIALSRGDACGHPLFALISLIACSVKSVLFEGFFVADQFDIAFS